MSRMWTDLRRSLADLLDPGRLGEIAELRDQAVRAQTQLQACLLRERMNAQAVLEAERDADRMLAMWLGRRLEESPSEEGDR